MATTLWCRHATHSTNLRHNPLWLYQQFRYEGSGETWHDRHGSGEPGAQNHKPSTRNNQSTTSDQLQGVFFNTSCKSNNISKLFVNHFPEFRIGPTHASIEGFGVGSTLRHSCWRKANHFKLIHGRKTWDTWSQAENHQGLGNQEGSDHVKHRPQNCNKTPILALRVVELEADWATISRDINHVKLHTWKEPWDWWSEAHEHQGLGNQEGSYHVKHFPHMQ